MEASTYGEKFIRKLPSYLSKGVCTSLLTYVNTYETGHRYDHGRLQ